MCQFRYEEVNYDEFDEAMLQFYNTTVTSSSDYELQPFECDEPEERNASFALNDRNASLYDVEFISRMDIFQPEEDDYETVNETAKVCSSRNATRRLASLTNTRNELVNVVHSKTLLQTIDTTECM